MSRTWYISHMHSLMLPLARIATTSCLAQFLCVYMHANFSRLCVPAGPSAWAGTNPSDSQTQFAPSDENVLPVASSLLTNTHLCPLHILDQLLLHHSWLFQIAVQCHLSPSCQLVVYHIIRWSLHVIWYRLSFPSTDVHPDLLDQELTTAWLESKIWHDTHK